MAKVLPLQPRFPVEEFYIKYLRIINGLLKDPLTPREISVLNAIHEESIGQWILTKEIRKGVSNRLQITIKDLNNFVVKIKRKGAFVYDDLREAIVIEERFRCPRVDFKDGKLLLVITLNGTKRSN